MPLPRPKVKIGRITTYAGVEAFILESPFVCKDDTIREAIKEELDITGPDGTGLPDAPSDTKQYARKDGAWVEVVGGGSYILKSASFTAEVGKSYALDTTEGSFDVTLPAAPTEGKEVCFCDARGTWNTHPPTFLRNGNKIEGQEINFIDSAQGTFFCALYIDATTGWRILESGTKPQNLSVPTISGNTAGAAITSTNGTWTGSPTAYSYKWQVSDDGLTGWADIGGATSATYTPDSGDEDKFVRVQVTAINSNGSSLPASSAASEAIEVPAFPSGAVAFWKLADLTDATGNGNTLTNNNVVTFAAGKIGDAAVFESGNGMYLSEGAGLNGGGSETGYTFAAWFLANTSGSMSISADDADQQGWFLTSGGLDLVFMWATSSWQAYPNYLVYEGVLTALTWHHFAMTLAVDGTLKVYCDSILLETISDAEWSPGHIKFGKHLFDSSEMDGKIDAVGIWNRALSALEIGVLYNDGTGLELA